MVLAPNEYELIDFGGGRKLERFGPYLLDRPAPAAEKALPAFPQLWPRAAARFERTSGEEGAWRAPDGPAALLPSRWQIRHGSVVLELKATPVGQLGVFPEQAANWDWLATRVADQARPMKVLNLFAYTGGSTLAAAAAGAEVVHVDAARTAVAWARRNAEISSLLQAPIRWITEDAATFVRRELRRGHRYDYVILDPPSYGHGPQGEVWKLAENLTALLADCAQLLPPERRGMLLTCHSEGFGPSRLRQLVIEATGHRAVEAAHLELTTSAGRALAAGAMARF